MFRSLLFWAIWWKKLRFSSKPMSLPIFLLNLFSSLWCKIRRLFRQNLPRKYCLKHNIGPLYLGNSNCRIEWTLFFTTLLNLFCPQVIQNFFFECGKVIRSSGFGHKKSFVVDFFNSLTFRKIAFIVKCLFFTGSDLRLADRDTID
jgi:hypothetical protein